MMFRNNGSIPAEDWIEKRERERSYDPYRTSAKDPSELYDGRLSGVDPKELKDRRDRKVTELALSGTKILDIAKEMHISHQTVRKTLARLDLYPEMHRRGFLTTRQLGRMNYFRIRDGKKPCK